MASRRSMRSFRVLTIVVLTLVAVWLTLVASFMARHLARRSLVIETAAVLANSLDLHHKHRPSVTDADGVFGAATPPQGRPSPINVDHQLSRAAHTKVATKVQLGWREGQPDDPVGTAVIAELRESDALWRAVRNVLQCVDREPDGWVRRSAVVSSSRKHVMYYCSPTVIDGYNHAVIEIF